MKMLLRVSENGGSAVDVQVSAVDLVRFEETFDKSVGNFQTDFRMKDLFWLAHHAMRRKDPSVPDFDTWLDTRDPDVEASDDDEIVPLENAQ
tara:strand:+ start:738 stop:1013 length:276 start_codon:yes stop_codon:yes gene_type:complete